MASERVMESRGRVEIEISWLERVRFDDKGLRTRVYVTWDVLPVSRRTRGGCLEGASRPGKVQGFLDKAQEIGK